MHTEWSSFVNTLNLSSLQTPPGFSQGPKWLAQVSGSEFAIQGMISREAPTEVYWYKTTPLYDIKEQIDKHVM